MFLITHIIAGLIIGKLTGNYIPALAGAALMDLDHLIPYIKQDVFSSPKKFWRAITDPSDPYGDQRGFMHSFFTWAILSVILFVIDFKVGFIISLGYLSHLLLDMIDGSDFHPFYPIKNNFRGPIPYFSKYELVISILLFVIFIYV